MSFVGWLDHSEDEQQQVRELLRMFTEKGTVDDLGIGTVRDAISNRVFPGTSVIQTRARYFLFIPWIFGNAERRRHHQLLQTAEYHERKLIDALIEGGDHEGLIGRQARKDVRTLPSAIYWAGLSTYGIFQSGHLTRQQYDRLAKRGSRATMHEEELVERDRGFWHAGIPEPPEGFFDFERADFSLTGDEARWLAERMLSTEVFEGPHLLGVYLRRLLAGRPIPATAFWEDAAAEDIPQELGALVRHGERFSATVRGAALLYNLMLREFRDDDDRGDRDAAASLRVDFDTWAAEATRSNLAHWCRNLDDFWEILGNQARIPVTTRTFIDAWSQLIATMPPRDLADAPAARTLIEERELQHKRVQARFGNRSRLQAWRGDSGLTPLEYRWSGVRRILQDIQYGVGTNTGAATDAAH